MTTPDPRSLRERLQQGLALSSAATALSHAHAPSRELHVRLRREIAVTSLTAMLSSRATLDLALAEARRRSDLFSDLARSTPGRCEDPYASGLESVVADVQKGLFG